MSLPTPIVHKLLLIRQANGDTVCLVEFSSTGEWKHARWKVRTFADDISLDDIVPHARQPEHFLRWPDASERTALRIINNEDTIN